MFVNKLSNRICSSLLEPPLKNQVIRWLVSPKLEEPPSREREREREGENDRQIEVLQAVFCTFLVAKEIPFLS
jgi:hypothetical protein